MKQSDIATAIKLCKEMIALEKKITKDGYGGSVYANKHSGAFKRRSMDLTRALADMRNPSRNEK